ncbi:acetyl-CoA carboxylase biotin carboxyl carrier protein [Virgibacillus dakarensis]|uniref:acetyl-CoA carboxylase biotin carboxyl carrier protein n=1 Tax=Virgibacillus dakarensis TaxID=1917889 RepID=UPI000B4459A9|nr:acetyl-CoA carboxylase biotin carboxyl carrier protein [Virgibacillus dakarensis]MBT2214418.1 acetyl-CoA carboxylase biotin carboxyl carrier protein [Virgibacillus dakarensis]
MLKVQEIRDLIELIDQSSIDEFTYETEGTTVSMKKAVGEIEVGPVKQVVNPVEKPEITTPEPKQVKKEPEKPVETPKGEGREQTTVDYDYEIESPMVGTLYTASSPEADPYVQKGSAVQKDTVVCIVEAMKLFNEIEAEVNGEIVEILVEDGELVEYGQPLFRVKTK